MEIKFRAFDEIRATMLKVASIDFEEETLVINFNDGEHYEYRGFEDVELMQFTGLTDKNGKEIYEGDILKKENSNIIVEVVEHKGAFRLCINKTNIDDYVVPMSSMLRDYAFEIIGNIYENKDLLK